MADAIGGSIIWNLDVAADKFNKGLSDAKDKAQEAGKGLRDLADKAVVPLGVGFATVTGIMYGAVKAFSDSQDVTAQLSAVLKSTGGAAKVTKDEVLNLSSALQQQSRFDDEAITGAQNMLLTFTKVGRDIFPQATKTVLDMSQALGQDLKSSSIQLGKALNDPINGITALRRVGVSFTDQQQDQIKTLVESGRVLDAQKLILKELGTEFGGSALTSSQTLSGQFIIMKNNFNDLQETIGKGIVDSLNLLPGGIEGVNKAIVGLNNFLKEHKDVLLGVVVALTVVAVTFGVLLVAALVTAAGAVSLWIAAGGVIVAVAAFVATLIVVHFEQIKNTIINALLFVLNVNTNVWHSIFATINGAVTSIFSTISSVMNNTRNFITNTWNGIVSFFTSIGSSIVDAITKPFHDAYNAIASVADKIKKSANEINPFVKHSPSLVENVQKGLGIIKDEYKSLGDIKIPPINHQVGYDYSPAVIQPNSITSSTSQKTQNINIKIGSIQDQSDIDSLIRELGYRS